MTEDQEIRARAADSAAHLLGPSLADLIGDGPMEVVVQTATEEWERMTTAAAQYIETGSWVAAWPASEEGKP